MRVSVFGLGYVGSVSAAAFAADGMMWSASTSTPTRWRSQRRPQPDRRARPRRAAAGTVAAGPPAGDDRHGPGRRDSERLARLRRHAEPPERQPRSDASDARLRADRRGARDKPLSRRRDPQHRAAGHDAQVVIPALEATRARSTAKASACPSTRSSSAKARRSRTSASRR